MKPLEGQLNLLDLLPRDVDDAQAAAGRRNAEGQGEHERCSWGDCPRPATHWAARAGEMFAGCMSSGRRG